MQPELFLRAQIGERFAGRTEVASFRYEPKPEPVFWSHRQGKEPCAGTDEHFRTSSSSPKVRSMLQAACALAAGNPDSHRELAVIPGERFYSAGEANGRNLYGRLAPRR